MAQEAVGRHPEDSLESAANDIRAGTVAERAHRPGISSRTAGQLALVAWARRVGKLRPANFITQFAWNSSGAEHDVFHDEESGRAVKVTRPNQYGHCPYGPEYESTPHEYFMRLYWQNAIFGDDVRILAVTLDDEGHVQVVHSQPWVSADETKPTVLTQVEIDEYFARSQFYPATLNPDAPLYYNREMDLIIGDAHEANVLRDLDGAILPIDIVIGKPGPQLCSEILRVYREPS